MFLPEIDDEVLVAFEHGDMNRPYVLGVLWNGVDKAPMKNEDALEGGAVNHRRIKTRYGHIIELEDTPSEQRIVFETPGGQKVVLRDGGQGGISIISKQGQEFYSDNSGKIGFVSDKGFGVAIDEIEQYVSVYDMVGNFITLSPASIDISATAMVNLKGSGPINIQGAMVNINSGPAAASKKKPSPDKSYNKKSKYT